MFETFQWCVVAMREHERALERALKCQKTDWKPVGFTHEQYARWKVAEAKKKADLDARVKAQQKEREESGLQYITPERFFEFRREEKRKKAAADTAN